MATRLIGTDSADPRLPALVVAATQGTTSDDLAPGDIGQSVPWSGAIGGGITIGTGTTVAHYARAGDVVVATFRFTLGVGSAVTGDVSLTLPVTARSSRYPHGTAWFDDSGGNRYIGAVLSLGTGAAILRACNASVTYLVHAILSATVPFTWAAGDSIEANLTYLAA